MNGAQRCMIRLRNHSHAPLTVPLVNRAAEETIAENLEDENTTTNTIFLRRNELRGRL